MQIGQRRLNRALLARQVLLERGTLVSPFLVDGAVAGTWSHVRDEFELIDAADRRALDEEGERLAALLAP